MRNSSKWLLVALFVMALAPFTAGAAPLLDCKLEYLPFSAPGLAADPTDEGINLYCKNKGDETATAVSVAVTAPAYVTIASPFTPGFNIAQDGIWRTEQSFTINDTATVGTSFELEFTVTYSDGAAVAQTPIVLTAEIELLDNPDVITITDWDDGPVAVTNDGRVVYENDDQELAIFDPATLTSTQLTFDPYYDCNSHPAISPDGSMIAWQRNNPNVGSNSELDEAAEIWVMKINGENQHPVVGPGAVPGCATDPKWLGNDRIVFRNDGDQDGYFMTFWVVNANGTGLRAITASNMGYDPFFEVGDGVLVAKSNQYFGLPNVQVIDIQSGKIIRVVPGVMESGQPSVKGRKVVYKDDWSNTGDLWIMNENGKTTRLIDKVVVREFQLSSSATTISLDEDEILSIESVVRADDPTEHNFWTKGATFHPTYNTSVITLPEPLSGSTPGLRTGVYVTYHYATADGDCYALAKWNPSGDFITYRYRFNDRSDFWAISPNGKKNVRLTFDNSGWNNSNFHRSPWISGDGKVVVSNDGTNLQLFMLGDSAFKQVGVSKGGNGGGSSSDGCGAVPMGAVPNVWTMLALLGPMAAGLGLRRRLRK